MTGEVGLDDVALGIDVGGTKVFGVCLDRDDRIRAEVRVSTPTTHSDGAELARTVADVARRLIDEADGIRAKTPSKTESQTDAGNRPPFPKAIGVGVPGMLDREGTLVYSPNLQVEPGAAIASMIEGAVLGAISSKDSPGSMADDRPTLLVMNDANAAAFAEARHGNAHGARTAAVITLGTGIGGAIVTRGTVVLGAHGFAGEFGHMTVDPAGPTCPCGRQGCWEEMASGGALGRMARAAVAAAQASNGSVPSYARRADDTPEGLRAEHVTEAAGEGDLDALALLAGLGGWVAVGLRNLVTVLDPDRFVIGGGLIDAGEPLLGPIRTHLEATLEGAGHRSPVPVVPAAWGSKAGAVGAAMAAREGNLGDPR